MNSNSITIIGGGINGLCSAYFLQKLNYNITIIDQGDITNSCSFGNMGFVAPSHFIPLAAPGIVSEGLSYMLSSSSPFYIKPRLNRHFLRWAYLFYRKSNQANVDKNSVHLEAFLKLSRKLTSEIKADLGDSFFMEEKGLLMMCRSEAALNKEMKLAKAAEKYGLETKIYDRKGLQELEPDVELDVHGGVLFLDDAHIHPGKLMTSLKEHLIKAGVQFQLNTSVTGFVKKGNAVTEILTDHGDYKAEKVLLSPGSRLPELTAKLGHRLMLEGGKGYSCTYENVKPNIRYPAILVDGRCAIAPWGSSLRIGGTMEFSGDNHNVLVKRMEGIYNSVKKFYPGLSIDMPSTDEIWTGLRPVSPDGLAYVGLFNGFENVWVAGGHAMIGMSLGAGTGKLISDLVSNQTPEIDLSSFDVNRFS